jgi:DNA mismatch repair protein MutL
MPRIKQLPPEEAQKIAAGEVIERPANVVKELIENALDAGATRITLYIEKSGKKLIRIVDDGCGMDEIDARACFTHHATSKITSVHDLHSINTFGFRGEALSSIASVSHITLTTNPSIRSATQDEGATRLELSEGRILSQEKASAPTGTDISIRDILFNVPVRKKFLKTDDTEWRHILHLVHAVALSRRDVHITLYHEGKQILNCPPVTDYLARAAQLWDADLAPAMIHCSAQERGITIEGMISDHTTYRYDRNALYFFVNGRWIKNYTLSRALMKGYANAIPASQFPTAALMITIDPAQIDVNIHPRKEEVQFLHPRIVDDLVQMAVKVALEARLSAQLKTRVQLHNTPMHSQTFAPRPAMPAYVPQAVHVPHTNSYAPYNFDATALRHVSIDNDRYTQGDREGNRFPTIQSATEPQEQKLPPPFVLSSPERKQMGVSKDEQTFAVTKDETVHTVLGVYDKTYIMVSSEDGILFIDQHAAHERILYEEFKTRFANTAIITLMFPHTLTFSHETLDILEPYLSLLNENGIHCKRQNEITLIITATPVYLKNASFRDLIDEMISCVSQYEAASHEIIKKQLTEKVHAQMACSAAVKAGDELSSEQIQKLLSDLAKTENRSTCPHGRPTSWLLGHDELVKKFQRDYLSKPKRPFDTDVPPYSG